MKNPKVGDVVKLNSGSPRLTITELKSEGIVEVSWICENKKVFAYFPEVCLTLVRKKK